MRILVHQTSYDEHGEPEELLRRARSRILAAAQDAPVDLVVLPELWTVGAFRPRGWAQRAEPLSGPTVAAMSELAGELGAVVHLGSIVESGGADLHNTAVVIGPDGGVLATYRKVHLFRAGGLESEILTAGDEPVILDLPLRDGSTLRTGLATCYDLRFPELFRAAVDAGAEAFLVPASWPAARAGAWTTLTRARAVENQALLVGASAAGADGRTRMAGLSCVVTHDGSDVARAGAGEGGTLDVEVDPADIREARRSFPVLLDRRFRIDLRP